MRVKVWGCRGSLASPGPETVRYGGNTSCVEVRLGDGTLIVLDAGTGIRKLGLALNREPATAVHVFLTHLHLDHIEGLGFFSALYNPNVPLYLWGPPSPTRALHERIARLMSPPLFPVHVAHVPSRPRFQDVTPDFMQIGTARVYAQSVSHRGPTVGYRIEEDGSALAYVPDHEPSLGVDLGLMEPEWISGYALAERADVLLHDSQYTEDEYPDHVGWGHSSVGQVVTFAQRADVRQLVMFHHDPVHTDEELEVHLGRARELWDTSGNGAPELAHEGLAFDL